jgi:hypothetical protein
MNIGPAFWQQPAAPGGGGSSALWHFDEAAGATSFADSSGNGLTLIDDSGGAATSVAQIKFGAASLLLAGGDGGYAAASRAGNALLQLGAGPFTIEFWVYFSATSDTLVLTLGGIAAAPFFLTLDTGSGSRRLQGGDELTFGDLGTNATVGQGAWHAVAVTRDASNVLRGFINGTLLDGAFTLARDLVTTTVDPMMLEAFAFGLVYVDELRINKGACLYTATYTPATIPFTS